MPSLREQHQDMLEQIVGPLASRRYKVHGSHSMYELSPGGPLLLVASGQFDRENRMSPHIRVVDAEDMAGRPGSALSCLWRGLALPVVIPATALEAALSQLTPTALRQYALKIRVRNSAMTLAPSEAPIDCYADAAYLYALRDAVKPDLAVPQLTHQQLQTLVAAVEHRRGCEVAIPVNDRTRLDMRVLAASGLSRLDVLPDSVRETRARDVDVVSTHRGRRVPNELIEVELGGDIRAALNRCAHVVSHLRATVGSAELPRVTIVASASRKPSFDRYVQEAPHPQSGFTELCVFRSFDEVYRDALRLLPGLPPLGTMSPN